MKTLGRISQPPSNVTMTISVVTLLKIFLFNDKTFKSKTVNFSGNIASKIDIYCPHSMQHFLIQILRLCIF